MFYIFAFLCCRSAISANIPYFQKREKIEKGKLIAYDKAKITEKIVCNLLKNLIAVYLIKFCLVVFIKYIIT